MEELCEDPAIKALKKLIIINLFKITGGFFQTIKIGIFLLGFGIGETQRFRIEFCLFVSYFYFIDSFFEIGKDREVATGFRLYFVYFVFHGIIISHEWRITSRQNGLGVDKDRLWRIMLSVTATKKQALRNLRNKE